ncbi:hypothetical protein Aduo_005389 [Ancylostoma duodenale]
MCDSRRVDSRMQCFHSVESTVGGWFSLQLIKQCRKDQIRVSGLTGNQLLQAIDELKKDFSRNRMEDHWLIPSISPLLALTAQELEKSRETSSIGDTQTGSADDSFSKVLQLEHVMKSAADTNDRNSGNSKRTSADSLDHILLDVEEKSVQLEGQLSLLERKISESKDINASTRERINQLLLRLNTSSCLVQRTCNGESDNDRKESSTSVLSFEITENDIDRARQIKEDKLTKEPSFASGQDVVEVEKQAAEGVEGAPKTVEGLNEAMQSSKEDAEVNDAHEDNVEEVFQKADAGMTEMANVSEDFHAVSQDSPHNEDSIVEQVGSETKEEASTENNGEEKEESMEQQIEDEEDNVSQHSFTTNNSLPENENQKNEVENPMDSEDHPDVSKENGTAIPLEEENENDGQEETQEKEDPEEPTLPDENEIDDQAKAALSEGNDNNEHLQSDAEANHEEGEESGSNVPSEGEDDTEKVQLKEIAEEAQQNNPENDVNNTAEQSESREQSEGEEDVTEDAGQEDQQTKQSGLNSILEVTENGEDEEQSNLEANMEHQEEDSSMNTPGEQEDQSQSREGEPAGENSELAQVKTDENGSGETEKKDENNLGDLGDDTNNNLENGVEEASNQGEQGMEKNNGDALESPSSGNALTENKNEENTDVAQNTSAGIIPNENSNFPQPGESSIVDENNSTIDSPCSILSKNDEENHLQNLSYEINKDGTAVEHNGVADNERDTSRNAFLSPQQSEALSSLGKIGALPEFELTHKYHIQSHINTAARVPVISQPVNERIISHFANLFTSNVCTICEVVQQK